MTIDDLIKTLYADQAALTDKGYFFVGNKKSKHSFADGLKKAAGIGMALDDEVLGNVAHESQHLIDYVGRTKDVMDKMDAAYAKMKEKNDAKAYRNYHAEQRAYAREMLAEIAQMYKEDKPKSFDTFDDFVKHVLRTVRFESPAVAAYMYEFLHDEAGLKIGLDDLPSDYNLKTIRMPKEIKDADMDAILHSVSWPRSA